ncbi:hypothetical protein CA603_28575 [Paraburkholderia hospita]|nr:hypothetical protein CA603_28575 [Paraburkholderia hospita]
MEYNSVLQQHLFLWQEHTKKLKFAEDTHIEQAAFLFVTRQNNKQAAAFICSSGARLTELRARALGT